MHSFEMYDKNVKQCKVWINIVAILSMVFMFLSILKHGLEKNL